MELKWKGEELTVRSRGMRVESGGECFMMREDMCDDMRREGASLCWNK